MSTQSFKGRGKAGPGEIEPPLASHGAGSFVSQYPSYLLQALWQHYPDNLFLIRVVPAGGFLIEAVNPALSERFGLDPEALEGRTLEDIHGEEVAREIAANYRECLRRRSILRYEESSRSPVGGGEIFETSLTPIEDEQGQITHLLGVSRAITRLRRAEQALRQNNFELAFELERKREELTGLREALGRNAIRDEVTGVYSRDIFTELAERELLRCRNGGCSRALVIFELENYSEIKDRFGEMAADAMLGTVVSAASESLREEELLGRCSGSRFIALLHREPAACEDWARELVDGTAALHPDWRGQAVPLTLRLGGCLWAGVGAASMERMSNLAVSALEKSLVSGVAWEQLAASS
ncbi:diguanylate cyclase [Gammaproteobacteria bacterium AB-CW1]|uniref:Diguanylate cyclase n=1 Tax=Natronospira elongata TaxID=3110268 RepID=A0AAP6JEU4_9GAMM|nr:diguanylate cyclase [Gammaproteobacteria bacterium AB-CW1]